MKKFTIALQVLFVALIASLACSVNNESGIDITTDNNDITTLTVADFDYAGQLHNDGLSYIYNSLTQLDKQSNEELKIQFVYEKSIEFLSDTDFNPIESVKQNTEAFLEYNDPKVFMNRSFQYLDDQMKVKSDTDYADKRLNELKKYLSENSYKILSSFQTLVVNNLNNDIHHQEFKNGIQELITDYNRMNYKEDDPEGIFVGSLLAISKYSLKWWEDLLFENRDDFGPGEAEIFTFHENYFYLYDMINGYEATLDHIHYISSPTFFPYSYVSDSYYYQYTYSDLVEMGAFAALAASAMAATEWVGSDKK